MKNKKNSLIRFLQLYKYFKKISNIFLVVKKKILFR
jgi:hypothetical protein